VDSAPALTIDMGGHPFGWHLAVGREGTLQSLRAMSDPEMEAITTSLSAVRAHMNHTAADLLIGGQEQLLTAVSSLPLNGGPGSLGGPKTVNRVAVPLASWVLIWGMFLDHALHDVSSKYPDSPERPDALREALRRALDTHPGYRMIEGLRDYVAHRGMPPVTIQRKVHRGPDGNPDRKMTVAIDPERLLESEVQQPRPAGRRSR
jgi:hypothetical protein